MMLVDLGHEKEEISSSPNTKSDGDFQRGEKIDAVKPTAVVDGRRRVREGDAPRDGLVSRGNHARGGTTGSRTRLCRRRSSRYARVYYVVVVVVARFCWRRPRAEIGRFENICLI